MTIMDLNYGSVSDEEKRFVETWESISDAQNYVVREDRRGDEQYVHVAGSQKFKITTYERILTQDKIRDKQHDPFTNGQFRPIIVPDSISVETNPNALSDDDVKRIFVASDTAWVEYMKVIDSPATLRRMLDLAEESGLSLKRFRELEQKERAANPQRRVVQKDQEQYDKMGPTGGSTASTSPAPSQSMRKA